MFDLETIKLSYKPKKNWLIFTIGIIAILFSPTISMFFKDTYSSNLVYKYTVYPQVYLYSFLSWKAWIIKIIATIIVFEHSKKILRHPLGFIILAIISPPSALILIGLLDYKIKDNRIKKIIKHERKVLKKKGVLKDNLEKEFNNSVLKNVAILIKSDKLTNFQKRLNEKQLSTEDKEFQLRLFEKNIELNLTNNKNDAQTFICPACGAKYYTGTMFCTECEITL